MLTVKFDGIKKAVISACDDIIGRELELSALDSFVGDGDHGVTVRKGYQKVKDSIISENPKTMGALLFEGGMALADTTGGAIGPILASMFIGFSTSVGEKEELSVSDLSEMFESGLLSVQDLGGAKPGDCTMVDALYPFVQSLKNTDETDVLSALNIACEKAFEGSENTKNLIPKLGRARNLGEKAIGYIDAGSRSMYYFLKAFSDNIE